MFTADYYQKEYYPMARTLRPEDLGFHEKSGWTIEGIIVEDYYEWVNDFTATHPVYGKIKGNFETEVTAESEEAHNHFVENHRYSEWDYYDI